MWSSNSIKNGNAETRSMTGWTFNNVKVVEGGFGQYCFKLGIDGMMKQSKSFAVQPPSFLIKAKYLPMEHTKNIDVKANITLELEYKDGTKDIVQIPCEGEVI